MAEDSVERRLAAMLAADVVGYSRMMGADGAGTLARLKQLRHDVFDPNTEKFGGRLFKTTGDGRFASLTKRFEKFFGMNTDTDGR